MEACTMAMGGNQWCEMLGWFIVENDATIRDTALVFQINKTRVHEMVTKALPEVNSILAKEVRRVLNEHKKDAPRRGGEATKRKYEQEKEMEHLTDVTSKLVAPIL